MCLKLERAHTHNPPPTYTHPLTHTHTHKHTHTPPPPYTHTHTQGGGLSAYHLEDIDSDDEEALLKADEPKPSDMDVGRQSEQPTIKPSKEELLQMMEKVDRDISALENQIVSLQKKQVKFVECCHVFTF